MYVISVAFYLFSIILRQCDIDTPYANYTAQYNMRGQFFNSSKIFNFVVELQHVMYIRDATMNEKKNLFK